MTQESRSHFVSAADLAVVALAWLWFLFAYTAAYPLDSASYAMVIRNQCTQDMQNKMKPLSFKALDSICRCVAETLLKELSAREIKVTNGKSVKVGRSLVGAYETCYLKAAAAP